MKGQYFIMASIILCSLVFLSLPAFYKSTQYISSDFKYILHNIESEFPHSLNLGLERDMPIETLSNFTLFVRGALKEKFLHARFLWMVSLMQPDGSVKIYVGNFLDEDCEVNLVVEGVSRNTVLSDGEVFSETFPSLPEKFYASLEFKGKEKEIEWLRDKTNLYLYAELSRNTDVAVKEIEA